MAEANPREERSVTHAEGHEENLSRREKKKLAKKKKRKEKRREIAEKEREEAEAKMNDPEEQRKLEMMEKEEEERRERVLKEFEERERIWIREMELKKEEERRKILDQQEMEEEEEAKRKLQIEEIECDECDDWEYVEEGPAEIIWQGNEIIIRKKKVKVPKKDANQQSGKEDADRPISNPLPPQSEAFTDYQNAQQALETVARQVPNFGTEQDKAHCPFHLKTGVCRFGQSCSRVHFYPDKSCTLLIKKMYSGPGLAWEQDEGLEYTDEEVERSYEEFYEDVHTEFLKFGEIVNFKVCKNGSFHLRGNVYVHYVSLESAVDAYNSVNGRYFAGKQIKCEFINVTRWKLAICGEYMKSRLKTCSHGTACNFIHCFRNPGGDYEWADWDKPPPKYWVKKMAALFGYSDNWNRMDQDYSGQMRNSHKINAADVDRHLSERSKSREMEGVKSGSRRSYDNYENAVRESTRIGRNTNYNRKQIKLHDGKSREDSSKLKDYHHYDGRSNESNSEGSLSDKERDKYRDRHHIHTRKSIKRWSNISEKSSDYGETKSRTHEDESDMSWSDGERNTKTHHVHTKRSSRHRRRGEVPDDNGDSDNKAQEDGDMQGSDGNGERDHRHTRKRSRDRSKVKYLDGDGDNKIRNDAGSIRDWLDGDKDRDKHRRHKKKSSVDQSNNPKILDDDVIGKHRTSDPDSGDDCLDRDKGRHGSHGRKRSRKGNTAHKHSTRRSHSMKENSEANYRLLKSNEDLESSSSDQYDEKCSSKGKTNHRHSNRSYSRKEYSQTNYRRHFKSNEDYECSSSDEYDGRCKSINKHDRWELVSPEEDRKSKRNTTSVQNHESDSPACYNGRITSQDFDSEYCCN